MTRLLKFAKMGLLADPQRVGNDSGTTGGVPQRRPSQPLWEGYEAIRMLVVAMNRFQDVFHVRLGHDVAEKVRRIARKQGEQESALLRRFIYLAVSGTDTTVYGRLQPDTGQEEVKEVGVEVRTKKENYIPSPEALTAANLLASRIMENNPKHKAILEPQILQWAHEADLMHGRDKRSWEDLMAVLEWSQADGFWKSNILSMATLRKQFDKLWVRMKNPQRSSYADAEQREHEKQLRAIQDLDAELGRRIRPKGKPQQGPDVLQSPGDLPFGATGNGVRVRN